VIFAVMEKLKELEARYTALYPSEPTDPRILSGIEKTLEVELPEDFKAVARFYRGGFLGGKSHHAMALGGPATNVVQETERLRQSISLPRHFIVLAEPAAGLIVMDTRKDGSEVIWCDATDAVNLAMPEKLRNPQIWNSYSNFFEYLLEEEEAERQ